jgi:hypothetical protein
MKLGLTPLLLSLFLQVNLLANADETNELYLTETTPGVVYSGNSIEQHHDQLFFEAKTNRESLPAKYFPEGNWGNITNGCQLSLRFDKQIYTNGEPITAIILIRDTTNRSILFINDHFQNEDGPFLLLATTDTGQPVPAKAVIQAMAGGAGATGGVARHTQRKYLERLNNRYDLTNGAYLIQAAIEILSFQTRVVNGKPNGPMWLEIKSAAVPIKIESPH